MSETAILMGEDPDGDAGVHTTVCLSLDRDRVPSCFLYKTEALSGGLDMVWLLSLGEVDREDGLRAPFVRDRVR